MRTICIGSWPRLPIFVALLVSGCFDFATTDVRLDAGDKASDAQSEPKDSETGSSTTSEEFASDSESTETATEIDDTVSNTEDPQTDYDTEISDTNTDSCADGNCPECDTGPCCDEIGEIKSELTICEEKTLYRCVHLTCGLNRHYQTSNRYCSGLSAGCSGKENSSAWIPLPDCATDEVCELDINGIAQCASCGPGEVCSSGECSCEYATCHGVCCEEEEHVCRWTETCGYGDIKINAQDGRAEDIFGSAVSISGSWAIVGAPEDDDNGEDSGSAYLFQYGGAGTWTQKVKLLASDGEAGDNFGHAVAINGDIAIVGAYYEGANGEKAGAAYVFERNTGNTWDQNSKLLASDGAAWDIFGNSVSVSNGRAIIAARGEDDRGSMAGAAYVFERNGAGAWVEKTKLLADDGEEDDFFAESVAISGSVSIVGAHGDDDQGSRAGAAYVFERDGSGKWQQKAKLVAADGAESDYFGQAVSVDGTVAIVGAYSDDDSGSNSGSAYVFERNNEGNWLHTSKLLADNGKQSDHFGISVSVSGPQAIVGAEWRWVEGAGSYAGAAFIFKRDETGQWKQSTMLRAFDIEKSDYFGSAVSLSGDVPLVGATGDDDQGSESGSAYIF